ncbi:hypothetical protein BT67DRAFT_21346 [Trichocladium antarcticum]|uniref:Uncharacterized protein n=1 Tax=Trichocladium antarcticum TaxID=1450529 RepID=A0AAN6ZI55_9PEZI|nr:hypothetical protein BT67DRAFT_21346 [Trichocladium antarcticum]
MTVVGNEGSFGRFEWRTSLLLAVSCPRMGGIALLAVFRRCRGGATSRAAGLIPFRCGFPVHAVIPTDLCSLARHGRAADGDISGMAWHSCHAMLFYAAGPCLCGLGGGGSWSVRSARWTGAALYLGHGLALSLRLCAWRKMGVWDAGVGKYAFSCSYFVLA